MRALAPAPLLFLLAVLPAAQSQTLRNSTPPLPANPSGLLLDPAGGPVLGGVWTPRLDNSPGVFTPPPLAPLWLLAVCSGPMVPELPHTYGVFLCSVLPPNPLALVGPVPAPAAPTPLPIPIPTDCSLAGVGFCTQAALVDATGIQLTNAIDIELGYVEKGLWGVDHSGLTLRQISTVDGSTIREVPLTYPSGEAVFGANGLARHPLTGELWAVFEVGPVFSSSRRLVRICPGDGTMVEESVITGGRVAGIAFDAAGTLYAVTGDGGSPAFSENLWTLDAASGVLTNVMALGNGDDGEAIGFNPLDGLIYHASGRKGYEAGTTAVFEKVDPGTMAVTDIPISGAVAAEEVVALSNLDTAGNVFYWTRGCCSAATPDLYAVTPAGVETYVGPLDKKVKGLAWNE